MVGDDIEKQIYADLSKAKAQTINQLADALLLQKLGRKARKHSRVLAVTVRTDAKGVRKGTRGFPRCVECGYPPERCKCLVKRSNVSKSSR